MTDSARAKGARCGSTNYSAVKPLSWDTKLESATQNHASDMARNDYYSHTGLDRSGPADRVKRVGYKFQSLGENIARGQTTAREVIDDWMASPGQCRNIMNGNLTELGAGSAVGSDGRRYWVQVLTRPA